MAIISGQTPTADQWNAEFVVKRVVAATTAAGTLASDFENGDTLDGVTLATNDRILIKDQATGSENGIYTVNAAGAPSRASDFDSDTEVQPNTVVVVAEGTSNKDSVWQLTTDETITVGSTALTFFPIHMQGTGSPEGVVTAPIGATYKRTDGSTGTTLYVKESGTGDTGWAAVGGSASSALRGARVYQTSATSVPNASTTVINFDSETFDTDTLHDTATNNSRVLLNKVGKWLVVAHLHFNANTTGIREARLNRNGTLHMLGNVASAASSGSTGLVVTDIVTATATTDYVELAGYQDSGGSLLTSGGTDVTFLAVTFLGA